MSWNALANGLWVSALLWCAIIWLVAGCTIQVGPKAWEVQDTEETITWREEITTQVNANSQRLDVLEEIVGVWGEQSDGDRADYRTGEGRLFEYDPVGQLRSHRP